MDGLDVSYGGVRAIHSCSFSVEPGQIVGFIGESGSGKSTILKSIMGLLGKSGSIDAGSITFDGMPLDALNNHAKLRALNGKVAYIFQDPVNSLDPLFTIGNQFDEVMRIHFGKMGKDNLRKRELQLLSDMGFDDPEHVLSRYPFELSGGMCQRVVIAMALGCEARLLLADEPTSALDVTVQAQVIALLEKTVRDNGLAMIIVSHNMGVIANTADMVGAMYRGEVVEFGTCDEILDNPQHPYTRDLIQAIPTIDGTMAKAPKRIMRPTHSPCPYARFCASYTDECEAGASQVSISETHWAHCGRVV